MIFIYILGFSDYSYLLQIIFGLNILFILAKRWQRAGNLYKERGRGGRGRSGGRGGYGRGRGGYGRGHTKIQYFYF